MSHADDTTLPCAQCGGDKQTGHQRLCQTLYTGEAVLDDLDDSGEPDELDAIAVKRKRTTSRAQTFRVPIVVQTPGETLKPSRYTVTFYAKGPQPLSLPPFPYAIIGTVLGHAKIVAYIESLHSSDVGYLLADYFHVAEIDLVEPGHVGKEDAVLRGTVLPATPLSVWERFKMIFLGVA